MTTNLTTPAISQLAKLFQPTPDPPTLMSSILHLLSSDGMELVLSLPLLYPLYYFPMICRVLAFLLLAPFALCIALDVTAYAIARTLHLSILPHRVPRSPPLEVMSMLPDSDTTLETYPTQEKDPSEVAHDSSPEPGLRRRTAHGDADPTR